MFILLAGVVGIVGALVAVMAAPAMVYLKRDREWLASDRSIGAWYR